METQSNKYTQEEVLKNIEMFKTQEEKLLQQRKELNKSMNDTRKQIQYWEDLDLSQLKMF
jgi:hypothetical protein